MREAIEKLLTTARPVVKWARSAEKALGARDDTEAAFSDTAIGEIEGSTAENSSSPSTRLRQSSGRSSARSNRPLACLSTILADGRSGRRLRRLLPKREEDFARLAALLVHDTPSVPHAVLRFAHNAT